MTKRPTCSANRFRWIPLTRPTPITISVTCGPQQNTHLDEAEDMVKRALQIDPNNGAFLDTLGWVEFQKGKFDQALTDLSRAAQNMTHDDPVVFEHIGDTCAKLNKGAQALEAWQKAAALDPQNKMLAEKIDKIKTKLSKGEPANANSKQ